jgi:hypothetical protein
MLCARGSCKGRTARATPRALLLPLALDAPLLEVVALANDEDAAVARDKPWRSQQSAHSIATIMQPRNHALLLRGHAQTARHGNK